MKNGEEEDDTRRTKALIWRLSLGLGEGADLTGVRVIFLWSL